MPVPARRVLRGFTVLRDRFFWLLLISLSLAYPMENAEAQGGIRLISQDANYLTDILSCTERFVPCTGDGASDFTSSSFDFVPTFGASHAFELDGATSSWVGEYTFLGTNETASESLLLGGSIVSSGTSTGTSQTAFAKGRSQSSGEVFFEVIGGTVTGSLEAVITPSVADAGDTSFFLTLKKQAFPLPEEVLVNLRARCCVGASPACDSITDSDCSPANLNEPLTLEPGVYHLSFGENVEVPFGAEGQSGSYSMQSEWKLELGAESPCDLAWASASPGAFDEAGNWNPQVVPGDDDAGCNNLIFDQGGTYIVTFDDGAAANSVRVLSGTPSLSGGSLALSGTDVTDALSISNQGQLTLNAGTITARGIGIGVDPPTPSKGGVVPASLEVKAGATLSSLTSLDIARQPGTTGLLTLEGGAVDAEALVTVQDDATLGAFGEALVISSGTAKLSVSGDLTLGQFAGSAATLDMVGASEPEVLLASIDVGGTLTVASEGQAGIRLAGLFGSKFNAARVGALAGSDGFVNVKGGPPDIGTPDIGLFEVTEDLVVGGGGKGTFVLRENAEVSANNVIVGEDDGANGSLQASGKGAKLKARQNVIVGDEGHGLLTLADGVFMEADSLIVGSNPGVNSRAQDASRVGVDGKDLPVEVSITGELIVGAAGPGELETLSKADVEARNLSLGVLPGSIGVVSFLGGFGLEEDLNFYRIGIAATTNVGVGGEGRLFTRDFGEMITRNMGIGIEPGGFGRFSAGGARNVTGIADELTIGGAGRGELSIEFATVLAGSCQLGGETGGSGVLQIKFGGRMVIAENPELTAEGESSGEFVAYGALQIGNKSNGLVEIFDEESLLSCKVLGVGGVNASAGGTLNVASGARAVIDTRVDVGGIIGGGPAIVRVANRGAMQIGTVLLMGPNGLFLTGFGANVSFSTIVIAGGHVDVEPVLEIPRPTKEMTAASKGLPGPAIFDGDMVISADGTLEVPAGVGEALVVTGAATLDGTLAIALEPGVTFNNDDLLGLIDFQGGVTGSFANVTFLNAPVGFDADIEFDGGTLQVRVINGGTATGEGEGSDEGEGEGDGEPVSPGGCQGCNAAGGPATKALGDWMAAFLGLAVLLGMHLRLQRQVNRVA